MHWLKRLFYSKGALELEQQKAAVVLSPAQEAVAAIYTLIENASSPEARQIAEYERKKEQRMAIEKDKLTQAIRVDVMRVLERPSFDLFEIRRIAKQMRLFGDLVGSVGHLSEHNAVRSHLQELEDVAPTVYAFLLDRAFDGEQLLKEGYERLIARQHEMQQDVLRLEQARDRAAMRDLTLTAKEQALELREEIVERDAQRVKQLSAQIGASIGEDDAGLIDGVKKRLLVLGEELSHKDQQKLAGDRASQRSVDVTDIGAVAEELFGASPTGASITRNFCGTKGKCPYDGDATSQCRLPKGHAGGHKCDAECRCGVAYWEPPLSCGVEHEGLTCGLPAGHLGGHKGLRFVPGAPPAPVSIPGCTAEVYIGRNNDVRRICRLAYGHEGPHRCDATLRGGEGCALELGHPEGSHMTLELAKERGVL